MNSKLKKIPDATLDKIAADISVTTGTRAEKIKAISDYYKTYGCNWRDLVSRYAHLDLGSPTT